MSEHAMERKGQNLTAAAFRAGLEASPDDILRAVVLETYHPTRYNLACETFGWTDTQLAMAQAVLSSTVDIIPVQEPEIIEEVPQDMEDIQEFAGETETEEDVWKSLDATYGNLTLAQRPEWHRDSICPQTDPEAFFPERGGSTREAKKVCQACPVRSECLDAALKRNEGFGIWGGLSTRERLRLQKQSATESSA